MRIVCPTNRSSHLGLPVQLQFFKTHACWLSYTSLQAGGLYGRNENQQ